MNSKAILYLILYVVIAYGVIYLFFLRPKPSYPPASAGASGPATTNSASASKTSSDNLPDGFISIAIDAKGNVVPESKAIGYLNVPVNQTPTQFCFNGKTYSVSRPSSGIVENGNLLLSGVGVSVSEGCFTGKLI